MSLFDHNANESTFCDGIYLIGEALNKIAETYSKQHEKQEKQEK